ncbi:MAG: hypothetical protein ACI4D4_05080 [Lachnospira sp.]
MDNKKDAQAAFMEAINGLKEYAKVNGGTVTREDVESYFKDMELDDNKFLMITGYLMANDIKIEGEDNSDNEFMKMLEDSENQDNIIENENNTDEEIIEKVEISKEEIEELPDKQIDMTARMIADNLDYSEDDKYLEMYKKDIESIQPLSDTTKSFLLVNIVEDNDKESLKLLSESFLEKIVEWIEPYRNKGVLACDLVQEGNLAMMGYVSEKQWLNNFEWKDKIKEGTTEDLMDVLKGIENEVKYLATESMKMLIGEQEDINRVSGKILNKVNYVNDWAVRLKEELGRKPTIKETAERMGVSEDIVKEAIDFSAGKIEDIQN